MVPLKMPHIMYFHSAPCHKPTIKNTRRFPIIAGKALARFLLLFLIDFAILVGPVDISKYNYMKLPIKDMWGVLMKKDSSLAQKECITPQDLWEKPLIVSRQAIKGNDLTQWLKKDISQLNIIAHYNLVYNASLMVDEGLGYALCLDKIINVTDTTLCFKPFQPKLEVGMNIVWKKYQILSKASEKFLEKLKEI